MTEHTGTPAVPADAKRTPMVRVTLDMPAVGEAMLPKLLAPIFKATGVVIKLIAVEPLQQDGTLKVRAVRAHTERAKISNQVVYRVVAPDKIAGLKGRKFTVARFLRDAGQQSARGIAEGIEAQTGEHDVYKAVESALHSLRHMDIVESVKVEEGE